MPAFPPADQPVSFAKPPVTEVALAIQFDAGGIDLEVLGDIAARAKPTFPRREQHPPLPPMGEEFGAPSHGPQIIFRSAPDFPRTWFVSDDGARLIQAQADRLVYNWRRADLSEPYPRYNALREELIDHGLPVVEQLAGGVPPVRVNVVEVTYVNELRAPDTKPREPHPNLSQFIDSLDPFVGEFLPRPEDANVQARWRIPGEDGTPIGRLYASAEPAYLRGEIPVYLLTVTARLLAPAADAQQTVEALDKCHSWVVQGFKDLTTDEMHNIWGLQKEGVK